MMAAEKTVKFKIFRFDPDTDESSRYDTFVVPTREGMTVLDGLLQILQYQDATLSLRFACREGVCGSCAMFINGSYRLACQTQLAELKAEEISVDPLPHMPIIKDLVVDMEPFFEKIEQVMPYLQMSSTPEKESLQSPKQREAINEVIDCILCVACYSACPVTWVNKDYLGPAALVKAYRFVADTRDEMARERLKLVDSEEGVWRCHTIFNCVEACPKKINQTSAIERLRRKALVRRLKFW